MEKCRFAEKKPAHLNGPRLGWSGKNAALRNWKQKQLFEKPNYQMTQNENGPLVFCWCWHFAPSKRLTDFPRSAIDHWIFSARILLQRCWCFTLVRRFSERAIHWFRKSRLNSLNFHDFKPPTNDIIIISRLGSAGRETTFWLSSSSLSRNPWFMLQWTYLRHWPNFDWNYLATLKSRSCSITFSGFWSHHCLLSLCNEKAAI